MSSRAPSIRKGFHRHARALEDGRASENVWINRDEVTGIHDCSLVQMRLQRKSQDINSLSACSSSSVRNGKTTPKPIPG